MRGTETVGSFGPEGSRSRPWVPRVGRGWPQCTQNRRLKTSPASSATPLPWTGEEAS